MWEIWVQSLGWEDHLEEGMATHANIIAWRIPMGRGAWLATVHSVTKSLTRLSDFTIGFPDSSVGKESACNAGDPVHFLGQEDLLDKG